MSTWVKRAGKLWVSVRPLRLGASRLRGSEPASTGISVPRRTAIACSKLNSHCAAPVGITKLGRQLLQLLGPGAAEFSGARAGLFTDVRSGKGHEHWIGLGKAMPCLLSGLFVAASGRAAVRADLISAGGHLRGGYRAMRGLAVAPAARVTGPRSELGPTVWLVGPGRALREEDG